MPFKLLFCSLSFFCVLKANAGERIGMLFWLPSYQLNSGVYNFERENELSGEISYESKYSLKDISTLSLHGNVKRQRYGIQGGYSSFGNGYYREHGIVVNYNRLLTHRLAAGVGIISEVINNQEDKSKARLGGRITANYLMSESTQFTGLAEYSPSKANAAMRFSGTIHHTFSSRINMTATLIWLGQVDYSGVLTYRAANNFCLGLMLSRGEEPISFLFTAKYLSCFFQFNTSYHKALGFSNCLSLCFSINN